MCSVHPSFTALPLLAEEARDGQPVLVRTLKDNAVIWPWDLLNWLWESPGSTMFYQWVSDNLNVAGQAVQEYWSHCEGLEFFSRLNLKKEDYATCIPVYWHMDGVKVYKNQKAWIYSFCSATRKGLSTETKLVFTLVRDTIVQKHSTHDEIAKRIGYCMSVLETGRFPHVDEYGRPFPQSSAQASRAGSCYAGGWTARFAGFKADWEGRVVAHKFERNYSAHNICEKCSATRANFGNFNDDAAYMGTRRSFDEYVHSCSARRLSAWVNVRGWCPDRNLEDPRAVLVQLFYCFLWYVFLRLRWLYVRASKDLLHVLHQGVAMVAIASCLCEDLEEKDPHQTLAQLEKRTGEELWNSYKSWCAAHHKTPCSHRFNLARLGREQWNAFPEMGSTYKGAVIKDMIYWSAAYLWQQQGTTPGSNLRCHAMHALATFQKKIDENPGFFNRRVARETANYARVFLLFYQRLAADDRAKFGEVRRCYKLTPKFHCMVNLAEYIEHSCRNPRCLARCQKFVVLSALACEFQIHRTRFKHPQMLVS